MPLRRRAVLVLLVLIPGCTVRKVERRVVPPDQAQTLDRRSPYLKAHLHSGAVFVFHDWSWSDSTGRVVGIATRYDAARTRIDSGRVELPRDSVALFETNVTKPAISARALTVMAGVTAAVALACATNPKACFGSCPTFYAPDSTGKFVLQAEGFSASIAPALEATDVDALFRASLTDRRFVLRVTNEALETHIIRRADLLLAPRATNGRVFVTRDQRFIQASNFTPPSKCTAGEGDCRSALASFDGAERWSASDAGDLGTRETVDLEFDHPPPGPLALVVTARQSLMTTYLIYQALAYMGTGATHWLAAMRPRGDSALSAEAILGRLLGTIEVHERAPSGEWSLVGETGETGPIAADTKLIPLTVRGNGPVRLRLRLTKGLWRLDWVSLASLGVAVTPARVRPVEVLRAGVRDSIAERHLLGSADPLTTLPGDALDLIYDLPANPERYDLFLDTRGYYLEWMRREWFAEENSRAVRQLLLDPAVMLRSLAPAFKRQEPDMERAFWGSRYVPR